MFQGRTETRLIHHTYRGGDHRQPGETQRAVSQPGRMPARQLAPAQLTLFADVVLTGE